MSRNGAHGRDVDQISDILTQELRSLGKISNSSNDKEDDDEPIDPAEAMLMQGARLRYLRQLEEADAAQRQNGETTTSEASNSEKYLEDRIVSLHDGRRMLLYESYLSHQRYYDDLKHIDVSLIDYGEIAGGGRMIIEQRKNLGKGGLCWDAAFILAEYLIANENNWNQSSFGIFQQREICSENTQKGPDRGAEFPRIIELGSGTGLAGVMLAKAIPCHVTITDLPELMDLMTTNLERNFDLTAIVPHCYHDCRNGCQEEISKDTKTTEFNHLRKGKREELRIDDDTNSEYHKNNIKKAKGKIWAKVLRWGDNEDYNDGSFDVVIGADVVASIYDPLALAQTFYSLSGPNTKIYLSYKERLTEPHEIFEKEMCKLFRHLKKVKPVSRNRNPNVWVMEVKGKVMS